jgi:general L-amino acid transport system substrate-binding protein
VFGEIVDWVMEVLVVAEEGGVTSASVKKLGEKGGAVEWDMTVRRLAGKTHEIGARLGLADDWAAQVVGAVGNYGEMYERDIGRGSAMEMERGWNRLARDGGLMAGLPLK